VGADGCAETRVKESTATGATGRHGASGLCHERHGVARAHGREEAGAGAGRAACASRPKRRRWPVKARKPFSFYK
jgi:hypothetical protein